MTGASPRPRRRAWGAHRRASAGRTQRGQATVEVALALPAVLLVLLAVVQAGLVVADHVRTVHVAREAARAVAVDGSAGVADRAAVAAGGTGCTATVRRPDEVGSTLTVTVSCPSVTDVPLVGALVPDIIVTARCSMRVER